MTRGFLVLLLGSSALAFAATWYLTGESREVVPVRAADGRMIAPKSCEEAIARGVAPLMAGQPGYSEDLDPDGDGLACPPLS
jgi:hypothetical protein